MVEIGQVISSKYKLLRLLGDGGMGSVYEAEHLRLGTRVALKVLHAELARKSGLIDRFLQEARVSAQIRSPHVVQVTDVESTPDGIAYLVMELLQGEPLSTVEKRERTLSVAVACEYTLQILQALEAAHSIGVIHRDLKPDNVFLVFDGTKPIIKLIDFGIAKLKRAEGATGAGQKNLTVAGMLMGTPEYMAPEQAYSAADIDVRADLYSVGVMLYEMLSGQTPAQGEDPRVVVLKVERGEVTPLVHVAPNVPPEVAGFVHRAMAPRPEMRFASAAEMRLALEAVLAGKRAGTQRLQGVSPATASRPVASPAPPPGAPGSGPPPPVVHGAPPAQAPHEQRTGTVMGGPAEGAFAPAHYGAGHPPENAQRPGTGTARAAPIDPAALAAAGQAPPPMGYGSERPPHPGMPTPAHTFQPGPRREKKSGAGLIIGLAVVALLLGAGAVVAYVMSTASPSPVVVEPLPTVTALTTPTPTTPATVVPTGPTPPITPLGPVVPQQPQTPVGPRPHPDGGAHADGGAAPSGTVPVFPPFPSGFPSAFPSAFPPFPSGFPTFQAPSGFPPIFPQSPPPAPQ